MTAATAAALLDRLDRVKQTGADRWIARCPAHEDRTPSLSVRETADGTVLIKCFGPGCSAADIVAAVGLELRDLFPPLPEGEHRRRPSRHRIPAGDRLALIDHETTMICLIADRMAKDSAITDVDHERLLEAARRIGKARDHA